MFKDKKVLIVQRVITSYRLELLKELASHFKEVGIITSKGESKGTLKKAKHSAIELDNVKVIELKSLKFGYSGDSRSTSLFLYPSVVKHINKYDYLILEGTTNILNNSYIIPLARLFKKQIVWWDSGYSLNIRTTKRKVIDAAVRPLIKMTHKQMAYSSKGGAYIKAYMGGKHAFTNLNTINTTYFESIRNEVKDSIESYKLNTKHIKLLYVGVIEERKKIEELIQVVIKLNKTNNKEKTYSINIIGGGNQLDYLQSNYEEESIRFHGPIYDKEQLKQFYFKSDLFVLPGDGGLAILQSLLYGLPVLCLYGADGTEEDYIKDKSFLLNDFEEIHPFLNSFNSIDRDLYLDYVDEVSSKYWIQKLLNALKTNTQKSSTSV